MWKQLVKVLQLKYNTISYTNKLYEGNKQTLLTQTLHPKTLKLLRRIKKKFPLRRAANLASLGKLLWSYFVTIIRTLYFRVQRPYWPHKFLSIPNQRNFDQLLTFVNFYQYAKNEAASSIYSSEILDLKTLQSDWFFPKIGYV